MDSNGAFEIFIAVGFEQRKALVRRDGDYRATMNAIKQIIGGPLAIQPIEKLALSVYIGELNDNCDIHPTHWEGLLPRINRVMVRILDVEAEAPAVNDLDASGNDKAEIPPPDPVNQPASPLRTGSILSINDSEDEKASDTNPQNVVFNRESTNDNQYQENNFQAWAKRTRVQRHIRKRNDDSDYSIQDDVSENETSGSAETETEGWRTPTRRTQNAQRRVSTPGKWSVNEFQVSYYTPSSRCTAMETKNPLGSYIAADYNGRKVLIPRDSSYQETTNSIKQVFESLNDVTTENISISAYLREHNECYEFDPANWQDLLPRIDHVVIKLSKGTLLAENAQPPPSEPIIDDEQPRELHQANPRLIRRASVISISDSDSGEVLTNNSVTKPDHEARNSEKRAVKRDAPVNDTPRKKHMAHRQTIGTGSPAKRAHDIAEWTGASDGDFYVPPQRSIGRKGRWSFSRTQSIGTPTTAGRKLGDIHFSNDKASPTGYRYWVVEGKSDPQWVPHEVGDAHPTFSRYKLRPSYNTIPPGWVLEATLREQFTGRKNRKPRWSL
ncbi:hypothetical protein RhiJN_24072 [Ceratobasidium sp. AG-Ba]|nr:hypothetical protein RhiJN_24072 [Ceratobasidium sp. AG-Ba]